MVSHICIFPMMKPLFTFFVIFIIIVIHSFAQSGNPYEHGMEELNNKNFIKAIGDFTHAIHLKPDFADAYFQRAIAKKMLAESVGFHNNEPCFDLVQALSFKSTNAIAMLESECMRECFHIKMAFFEPEIVFCADFTSKILYDLPENSRKMVNLIKLNLYNNKLTDLPNDLREFKNLIYLDLSSNKLTHLSDIIAHLHNLSYLNLNKNQISTLPDEIEQLVNLKYLFLRNNVLYSITYKIGDLTSLVEIDLSFNNLTSLPIEIGYLKNLKTLNLLGNTLNYKEKRKISQLLPDCTIYF